MQDNLTGLSEEEAKIRQEKFGLNILPEKPPPSNFSILFAQLKNPLVLVLLLAVLSTVVIRHFSDAVIILAAVIFNSFLGFIQEKKASNAFLALNKFLTPKSLVLRNSQRIITESKNLVPQDLVVLALGDKVPADGKLVFANRLFVNESLLTGESAPVSKKESDEVFMGTAVFSGQGVMEITQIGALSKMGKIALEIQKEEEETPIKKQLDFLGQKLLFLILVLIGFIFIFGLLKGLEIWEILTTSVALAVSVIPEGLPISLTVILALGMQKILRRKGLVKNLQSVETLGSTTTICLDKTGTLTLGKMQLTDYIGIRENLVKQTVLANDLDDPIVIAAYEWAKNHVDVSLLKHPRLDSLPFSPQSRFFASLHFWDEKNNMVFVNGAPELLLKHSTLNELKQQEILKIIEDLSGKGKRLVGLAQKIVPSSKTFLDGDESKSGLEWVGILAFFDPVRVGVKEALSEAQKAGIKLIVITGDFPATGQYVLAELGLAVDKSQIMTGHELEQISLEELSQKVKTIKLFARTTPDQKSKIVEALKRNNEVVAMMGDGVNDAPALHLADIGIVVADSSEVAKESADLVLLDSNFSTIMAVVEEGRGIIENLKKVILYLLSDAFCEIFVVFGSIFLSLPLPVTAVQILWINLVSDGFPGLSLTVDPIRKDILKDKPKGLNESLINSWMIFLIGIISLTGGFLALLVFVFSQLLGGSLELSRSLVFATLGLNSLLYVFSVRTLKTSFSLSSFLENKWLVAAVLGGFLLQILPFSFSGFRHFFGLEPLGFEGWLLVLGLSFLMFLVVEILKILGRKYSFAR